MGKTQKESVHTTAFSVIYSVITQKLAGIFLQATFVCPKVTLKKLYRLRSHVLVKDHFSRQKDEKLWTTGDLKSTCQ